MNGSDLTASSPRLIQYASSHGALVVAPDYRLIPEATGADILDDVEAFWDWLHGFLPGFAQAHAWTAQPDLGRILSVGQSTGGCLAVQSALIRPEMGIRAVVSLYAPLVYNVPSFTVPRPRRILGTMPPPPGQAERLIRAHIKRTRGTIRTTGDPAHMWELLLCIMQQGRVPSLMNTRQDPRLDIVSLLNRVHKLPPLWLVHGKEDSVVSCSLSHMT